MASPKKTTAKLPNILGGLGYLSIILQWLWSLALLLPVLLANNTVREFVLPNPDTKQSSSPLQFDSDSFLVVIVAVVITVVVLAVTAVILVRLPIALVKTSRNTVNATVETIIPVVTHHKKTTKKKQRQLVIILKKYIKMILILIPVVPFSFVSFFTLYLDADIAVFIVCLLAIGSLLWFSAQYLLARLLAAPTESLI